MTINGVDNDIKLNFRLLKDLKDSSLYQPISRGVEKNDLNKSRRELLMDDLEVLVSNRMKTYTKNQLDIINEK
jgi:hypothetical protein